MAVEIERKFLVRDTSWKDSVRRSIVIKQGYLSTDPDRTVRIRIKGDQGVLTVKGRSSGVSRAEFEYETPRDDAEAMLALCDDVPIEKIRHEILIGGKLWELDVFEGANQGLVLAEIELADENEVFELPSWVEKEVSEDVRYYNSYLSKTPYATWK